MWVAGAAFSFARERMSEGDLAQFIDADAASFKQALPGAALFLMNAIRAISPGAAFNMVAKQNAYRGQWMMPGAVTEVSKNKSVSHTDHCKGLDYPHGEDVCQFGCQQAGPRFMADLFKVKTRFERQGDSCTMTVTPL